MANGDITAVEDTTPATAPHTLTLGWGKFLLQFVTVFLTFIAASVPPVLVLGMSATGVLLSVAMSMGGALLVAFLWLRGEGRLAQAWNLARPANWGRTVLHAALAALVIIAWFQIGALLFKSAGGAAPEVANVIGFVTQSPATFVLWIVLIAWLAAGLGEELLYRGFLMDRLLRLRGVGNRIWLVIVIQAVLFGLPHLYQGLSGVVITAVVGLWLGWLRIRDRGNLWVCVLAHAAVDTVMMSMAYAEKLGWMALAN